MKRFCYILTFASLPILIGCQRKAPLIPPIDNPEGLLLAQSCSGCHDISNETLPDISGLSRVDLLASLKQYRDDTSGQTVMHRLMQGYDDPALERLADTLGRRE